MELLINISQTAVLFLVVSMLCIATLKDDAQSLPKWVAAILVITFGISILTLLVCLIVAIWM